jgi:transcriptional regulator with XRE-family HTH domain
MSQEELAARAGTVQRYVSQVEQGRVSVGLDVLAKLATALNVDVADLLGTSAKGGITIVLSKRDANVLHRLLDGLKAAGYGRNSKKTR